MDTIEKVAPEPKIIDSGVDWETDDYSSSPIGIILSRAPNEENRVWSNLDQQNGWKLQQVMLAQKLRKNMIEIKRIQAILRRKRLSPFQLVGQSQADSQNISSAYSTMDSTNECDSENNNYAIMPDLEEISDETDVDVESIYLENLPRAENSFSETLVQWVSYHQDEVIERAITVTDLTRKLAIGNVAGYASGFLIKKFGKIFLCSLASGAVLLNIAHSRGYVDVAWEKVYGELGRHGERGHEGNVQELASAQNDVVRFLADKTNSIWIWSKENSAMAAGFAVGFVANTIF